MRLQAGKRRRRLTVEERRERRARRRAQSLRALPSLFTVANAMCGFAAIVQVAAIEYDPATRTILNPQNLANAGWLLLLGMLFDGLDGRIARLTNATGDFGGELDSLADAITFGVAPALMVVMANARAISEPLWWKLAWVCGLIFVAGAILRLARFNVEVQGHDEGSHSGFKGLPSPAAAGTIATLAILQGYLRGEPEVLSFLGSGALQASAQAIGFMLPFVALFGGWLMISNVTYIHVGNRLLGGSAPARRMVQAVIAGILLFAFLPHVGLALVAFVYAASGPAAALVRHLRSARGEGEEDLGSRSGADGAEGTAADSDRAGATLPPAATAAAGNGQPAAERALPARSEGGG